MTIAIIGCGDAGLSAAFAAAKEGADVVVISDEKDYYPRCPLPYYISGEVKKPDLVRPLEDVFKGTGVKVVFDRAVKICGDVVICEKTNVRFDKAIIATGARAKRVGGSLVLRTLADADEIKKRAKKSKPVIIGGGMLGCELADVLGGTIVEAQERILPNFDPEFSEAVKDELLRKKVAIKTGTTKAPESDFVISAVGVLPDNELAKNSGIRASEFGIVVNDRLETSMKGVYAAGDCIEERCFFTKRPMHSYLGPQSEREGVIAGTNAAGGDMRYGGSLNAVVARIGGHEIGTTGLCSLEAERAGFKLVIGKIKTKTRPEYDKTAEDLAIKMMFDGDRLVGCQAIGGDVDGVINLASYAMQHGATVDDLINLAYCFSPPVCSAPNPIILCAENAKRRMKR